MLEIDASARADAEISLRAKHCLLDWLGVAIAGATTASAQCMTQVTATQFGREDATIIGMGRSSCAGAAFANAYAGHVLDFDDTDLSAWMHHTAAIAPAAFALAEQQRRSGLALLKAFTKGVALNQMLGREFGPIARDRGWHPTALFGAAGAACACAALLELDADATASAIALTAASASGVSAAFGSISKPYQVAKAAQSAVEAAHAAKAGMVASPHALWGEGGLIATACGIEANRNCVADIDPFDRICFKFTPACFGLQAPAEAARLARAQVRPDATITAIEVWVSPAFSAICKETTPRSLAQAQFSLPFVLALILSGASCAQPSDLKLELCQDHDFAALMRRVRVHAEPGLDDARTRLRVTADGQRHEFSADLMRPAPLDEETLRLQHKFLMLAEPLLGARAGRVVAAIQDLERLTDVRVLFDLLRP